MRSRDSATDDSAQQVDSSSGPDVEPRAAWTRVLADSLAHDLRYGLRLMGRAPGFTAAVVLLLALGIGANTAIFSLIDAVMLRKLPVREAGQLVELVSTYPGEPRMNYFGWNFYEHYRERNHVFSDLIGVRPVQFQVAVNGEDRESLYGEYVVGDFFSVLGLRPATGRLIAPQDDKVGAPESAVAVVSWSYWQRRLNLNPSILGTQIVVNGVPATVIGVAPREFFGLHVGIMPALWIPAAMEPLIQQPSQRLAGSLGLALVGRLKPGVSIEQARAEMTVLDRVRTDEIAKRSNNPQWRQVRLDVQSAATGISWLRDVLGRPLLALMTTAALLLLIACTSVASMLLARSTARQSEIATRVALGASRTRLVGQLLIESALLSVSGGAIGVLVAYLGADALARAWPMDTRMLSVPLEISLRPDLRVLLFTGAVAMATAVLCGLAPAWSAFAPDLMSLLRKTGPAGETRTRRIIGQGLVIAQVALSVVLLSAVGLFVGHVSSLRNRDLGFERDSVLLVTLDPARSGFPREQLIRSYQELLGRFEAIPGVRSATFSGITPIAGGAASRFVTFEGVPEKPEDRRYVSVNWVAPKYFRTFGTPLLDGREFGPEDGTAPRLAIVNKALARHYFGEKGPIGRHFRFDRGEVSYEVVGVVGDAKYADLRQPAPRTVYLSALQEACGACSHFALRIEGRAAAVINEARRAVSETLKGVPVSKVTTLTDQLDASIRPERFMAKLSGAFGMLAALLAALGLYGLLAYTVTRRTKEIGIRMALGATRRDVTRLVLANASKLVVLGVVLGIPVAVWAQRVGASLLENLRGRTAVPIAMAVVAMMVVALFAAFMPARRAAGVNAMEALRDS
jgi:putative ABC transport system permease protein